jgi:putative tryptophan/tyrosine transport system substrate-binding protein
VSTRLLGLAVALALLGAPLPGEAQPAGKVHRIGVLRTGSPPPAPDRLLDAFRQRLHELGYVEGKNIALEPRWVAGKVDRFPAHAAELVRLRVDVIVVSGSEAALAARNATGTIPVVMAFVGYPVELGLITSLARPGGNVTGLSNQNHELDVKRLELLKEVAPRTTRIALLWNPPQAAHEPQVKHLERAARSLGVRVHPLAVRVPEDLDGAFSAIRRERAGGVAMLPSALNAQSFGRIAEFALKARLPTIAWLPGFPAAGGLMAYGANTAELTRRAASYVDRILKGGNPAEMPVEQPTKFELIVNLKTAKALGLTIPPAVLARADEVIQ